jgi:hypothetical protein
MRMPMYDMTANLMVFRAGRRTEILFASIEQNEEATEGFLVFLTGAISPKKFFAVASLAKALGLRTMLRLLCVRARA